jgi:hypothetical protein
MIYLSDESKSTLLAILILSLVLAIIYMYDLITGKYNSDQDCQCSLVIDPEENNEHMRSTTTNKEYMMSTMPKKEYMMSTISNNEHMGSTPSNNTNNDNNNNKQDAQKNVLCLYYLPGCGHCENFLPIWNELKKVLENSNFKSVLDTKKINCGEDRESCMLANINGVPTVILYKKDGSNITYDGDREIPAIMNFLQKELK